MASMTEITCKCGCGRKKMVRTADVKRGWGKFYDKSCKAREQERRTHQHANHKNRVRQMTGRRGIQTKDGIEVGPDFNGITDQEHDEIMSECEMGWDAHKDSF